MVISFLIAKLWADRFISSYEHPWHDEIGRSYVINFAETMIRLELL